MNVIESQVFSGEMYMKVSDHHRALEHYRQEVDFWRQRYEALVKAATELSSMRESKPPVMLANKESYEAGRVMERQAMLQLFTDPENQPTQHGTVTVEYMQREIAAEREACAEVCDELADAYQKKNPTSSSEPLMRSCWNNAAAAIRARGRA